MNIVYFCQASESRKSMLVRLELHPPSLIAKAPWKNRWEISDAPASKLDFRQLFRVGPTLNPAIGGQISQLQFPQKCRKRPGGDVTYKSWKLTSQMRNVWYISLRLPPKLPKCR